MLDFNYDTDTNTDAECLDVSVRSDGVDDSGNYKFICKLTHKGHQSYRQSFGLYFSTHVTVVEVPGDVDTQVDGNHITFSRKNQMNDNGLVEIWIKLSAGEQPEVTGITDVTCLPDVNAGAGKSSDSQAAGKTLSDGPQEAAAQSSGSSVSETPVQTETKINAQINNQTEAESCCSEPQTDSAAGSSQEESDCQAAEASPAGCGTEISENEPVRQAIYSRRSVRSYKPDMLPKEIISKIIESGTYAATGMNRQSPIIIAVTDKKTRDSLSEMNAKIMGTGTDPFYGAPVVLIVLADKEMPTYLYDGSLVLGNMMLAAEELGIGSCWVHRAKEEFESDAGKEILQKLGIDGNYEGIGHLILGYAAEEKKPAAPRKENYVYYIE